MQITIKLLVKIFLISFGFLTTLTMILNNNSTPYYLFLIPLTYSILIICFPPVTRYIFSHLGVTALNIVMFLRYVLSPLLNSFYGVGVDGGIIPSAESYDIAIYLMLYEMLTVFVVFSLFYKYFYRELSTSRLVMEKNITGWLYILFCIFLIAVFPQLLDRYTFILIANELESKELNIEVVSFIPLLLQMGSLVLMVSLLNIQLKKYMKNNSVIYVLASLLIVTLISSFIIGTSRFSIILPLITGLFIIFMIFKKYRKLIAFVSIIISFLYVSITTYLKSNTVGNTSETISSMLESFNSDLQLYFSGITNVAIAIEASNYYVPFQFSDIFADLIRNVVLINSYFTSETSVFELYNIIFYNGGAQRDQILPMIGQGFLYFGFILGPILTIIILIFMMYLDSKSVLAKDVFTRFIFSYVTLKFGLFMMANFTNLLSFYVNQFLLLLLIFYINKKLLMRKKE